MDSGCKEDYHRQDGDRGRYGDSCWDATADDELRRVDLGQPCAHEACEERAKSG